MTSLLGHILEVDFNDEFKKWTGCQPLALFEAPIMKFPNDQSKKIIKNLKDKAKWANILMIWTDCDREGENIGNEIVEICCKVNKSLQVYRPRFSVILHRYLNILCLREINQACQNPHRLDKNLSDAVDFRIELDLRIGAALTRFQSLLLQPRFKDLDKQPVSYGIQYIIIYRALSVSNFRICRRSISKDTKFRHRKILVHKSRIKEK